MAALKPARAVMNQPYRVPRAMAPVDLFLDSNEGQAPQLAALSQLASLSRYPDAAPLTRALASRLGISEDRVVVTAGADDAIDRACRAVLEPGRNAIIPVPGFVMVNRYVAAAGAEGRDVTWSSASFPLAETLAAIDGNTRLIVLTTPNNPTGCTLSADTLACIAEAAPQALVLVDLAYVEFANDDPTLVALAFSNTLVVRTFSKAYGCAGLRVGYAAGAPEIIRWLKSVGPPYAVSSLSLALATQVLNRGPGALDATVAWVRQAREELTQLLLALHIEVWPSQANFVLCRVPNALWFRDAMAGLGIAVRAFPGRANLDNCIRIALPSTSEDQQRLCGAVQTVLAPQALLFDLDGVIANVSQSYRQAIAATTRDYGLICSLSDIQAAKDAGGANNDWVLTRDLLDAAGISVPLARVTETFESHYQGDLWRSEDLLCSRDTLARWSKRYPLAVVTGRPRKDALRFLEQFDLLDLFQTVICLEDAPSKPDPAPVQLALSRLGIARAWMFGDTPNDMRAARSASVLPLGIGSTTLVAEGAARTWQGLDDVEVVP